MERIIFVTVDSGSLFFHQVVEFVAKKYKQRLGAFSPIPDLYAVAVEVDTWKIAACIGLDFGWRKDKLYFERIYTFPKGIDVSEYDREKNCLFFLN